jgi:dTDP-4-amino-4,6-dideoxygalactose transaminase
MCSHREAPYQGCELRHDVTNSEQAQDGCILLPLYVQMTAQEQDLVVAALRNACLTLCERVINA